MERQQETPELIVRTRRRTKSCPFCAEEIRYEAVKCRFCGEFLRADVEDELRPGSREADRGDAQDGDTDILWSGRPSVLALTRTAVKIAIFVAVCGAIYHYRVTALVTLIPKLTIPAERLALVERYIDQGAITLIAAAVLLLTWKVLMLKSIHYEVTPDRIEWSRGVFDRKVDNLDMFRITDLKMRRSLVDCLVGIGTVQLATSDDSTPQFDFVKVRRCRYLYGVIKEAALEADKKQGVVHFE